MHSYTGSDACIKGAGLAGLIMRFTQEYSICAPARGDDMSSTTWCCDACLQAEESTTAEFVLLLYSGNTYNTSCIFEIRVVLLKCLAVLPHHRWLPAWPKVEVMPLQLRAASARCFACKLEHDRHLAQPSVQGLDGVLCHVRCESHAHHAAPSWGHRQYHICDVLRRKPR